MSCPAIERLAAAASGEDAEVIAHAATCAHCGELLDAQHEVVAAARLLPEPPIDRAQLLAEFAARLEWRTAASLDDEPRRRWGFAIAGALAIAAVIALVVFATRPTDAPIARAPIAAPAPVAVAPPIVVPPPPPSPPPSPPVDRSVPPKRVRAIAKAPRPVQSPAPVEAPPPVEAPASVEAPPHSNQALWAFRLGWQALRNGHNAEAIEAFDRATDPAVIEDATFWAAIATMRAGDRAVAKARLQDFLEQFPQSPHADAARAALATL